MTPGKKLSAPVGGDTGAVPPIEDGSRRKADSQPPGLGYGKDCEPLMDGSAESTPFYS